MLHDTAYARSFDTIKEFMCHVIQIQKITLNGSQFYYGAYYISERLKRIYEKR